MKAKIYADFNGIEVLESDPEYSILNLTGYGTLASLSKNKIRLEEGMKIEFFDPDGLSALGAVTFIQSKKVGNCSGWFAKIAKNKIIDTEEVEFNYNEHLCFSCRENLKPYLDSVGRNFKEKCPSCGTPVMFPLLAPLK